MASGIGEICPYYLHTPTPHYTPSHIAVIRTLSIFPHYRPQDEQECHEAYDVDRRAGFIGKSTNKKPTRLSPSMKKAVAKARNSESLVCLQNLKNRPRP